MALKQMSPDFFYFAECTSPDPSEMGPIDYKIQREGDAWWLEFIACLHVFELINRNTRQYLGDNVMEHVFSPKNKSMMKHNGWFGEMDHPAPIYEDQKLTRKRILNVWMPNRSHKIIDPTRKGNKLFATIQTAAGNVGHGFRDEIVQGHNPPFSCRSTGELVVINNKPTVMVSNVVTYDWVPYAGFEDAAMVGKPSGKRASIVLENGGEQRIDTTSSDIMIPFSELADDLAETDGKVNVYMESFDNDASIVGVTNDMKNAVIKRKGLYIYAGIDEASVARVKDFYNSFPKR